MIEEIEECSDPNRIKDEIEKTKFGSELQSYKTGSINGVKNRIRLFKEGVEKALDC